MPLPGSPRVFNAWSNPSIAGREEAVRMAMFLEERACFQDQEQVNSSLRSVLSPSPGENLLEVGSGSGVLCRQFAEDILPGGSVTGLDVSQDLVGIAQQYAAAGGLSTAVHFDVGRAEALPYPQAGFDAAFAARLLLHVEQPKVVVREMARVVRAGGRVVLLDWDFDTLAIDHTDRDLTRRIIHWRNDNHGGNNWCGRQLWSYVADTGLQEPAVFPVVCVARDESAALTQSIWRAAQVARDSGAITTAEHDTWVGELKDRVAAGRFFASIVYFIVRGIKR